MRALLLLVLFAGCATPSQGPTIYRSYDLPGRFMPPRVAPGFPLVLAATRDVYPIEAVRPDRGALLTASHRLGGDDVAFLVWVTPGRKRSVKRLGFRVELTVTVQTVINGRLVPPDRVATPILDEENRLLAAISNAGKPYEGPDPASRLW